MIDSNFELPLIEERPPAIFPQVGRVEFGPPPIYHQVEPGAVNGSRILHAVNYDHAVCASVIADKKNYKQLLESIVSPELIKNVGALVISIRQGLGLPIDLDIAALTQEGKVLDYSSVVFQIVVPYGSHLVPNTLLPSTYRSQCSS
jgi:hypothetical protein